MSETIEIVELKDIQHLLNSRQSRSKKIHSLFDIPVEHRMYWDNTKSDYLLIATLLQSKVYRLSRKKIYFEISDDPNYGILEKKDRDFLLLKQFMILMDIEDRSDENDEIIAKFKKKNNIDGGD